MNRTLKKLIKECFETDSNYFYKKVGNYSIKREYDLIIHYYYGYSICKVRVDCKKFISDSCGFIGYRLITAQLNFLEQFYKSKEYKLIWRR